VTVIDIVPEDQRRGLDSREHEHAQRIIDHRFIVYWHQLLGSGQSQWVKPSAGRFRG
jgi:hypothetical protein